MTAATSQPATDARPFVVYCCRQDGREREFARYPTVDEAQRVSDRLSNVGCVSRVARVDMEAVP